MLWVVDRAVREQALPFWAPRQRCIVRDNLPREKHAIISFRCPERGASIMVGKMGWDGGSKMITGKRRVWIYGKREGEKGDRRSGRAERTLIAEFV